MELILNGVEQGAVYETDVKHPCFFLALSHPGK